MVRVMLHTKSLPEYFWAEAVNRICHIHIRIALRSGTTITSYKLWKGQKPNIKYFLIFGCKCYINGRKYHQKWDWKFDERIFLGYFIHSKAYRVFNKRTNFVVESINVWISDTKDMSVRNLFDDEDVAYTEARGRRTRRLGTKVSRVVQVTLVATMKECQIRLTKLINIRVQQNRQHPIVQKSQRLTSVLNCLHRQIMRR